MVFLYFIDKVVYVSYPDRLRNKRLWFSSQKYVLEVFSDWQGYCSKFLQSINQYQSIIVS